MRSITQPLVGFDHEYYRYPKNIHPFLLASNLNEYEKESRTELIEKISRSINTDFHVNILKKYIDEADSKLLQNVLGEHGIFGHPFFHRRIKGRILGALSGSPIEAEQFSLICAEALGYRPHISNIYDISYQIAEHIFEFLFLEFLSNPVSFKLLKEWFKKHSEFRSCNLCRRQYRVIDLPSWVYFGSDGCKDCCFICPILRRPKKAELAILIPTFVDQTGFVPNSDASPITYSFNSRLSADMKISVYGAYAEMGGIDHVKRKYGSWFAALAKTGILPNGTLITARGIRCLAKDGHICNSLEEQLIDDWLAMRGVKHEKEPHYPVHPQFNPKGNRRADWQVGDVFVEYFGMIGDRQYEKRMTEKIVLANRLGISLIAIYPADLKNLDLKLKKLEGSNG